MASQVQTYGIVLVRGNRYHYKGVMFKRGHKVEVDRAARDHLVGSGHFRDIDYEAPVAQPIPVRRTPATGPITESQIKDAIADEKPQGHTTVELGDTSGPEGGATAPDTEGSIGV